MEMEGSGIGFVANGHNENLEIKFICFCLTEKGPGIRIYSH